MRGGDPAAQGGRRDRRFEAGAWQGIGYARKGLGDLESAVSGYETSRSRFAEIHDDFGQAGVLDHLAAAHLELGDVAQARRSWTGAAELLGALRSARAAELRANAAALPEAPADD